MVFRAAAAAVRITPAFDVQLAGSGPYLGRRKEVVRVVREAAVAVRPAKLRYSVGAIGGLAYNRERPDGAVDGSVYALWVDSLEGPPLAVIYGFGCHAVVLRDDNRLISADFPGVAS